VVHHLCLVFGSISARSLFFADRRLEEFVGLYANHKPVDGVSSAILHGAFEALAK
jgi:hypothetical protein